MTPQSTAASTRQSSFAVPLICLAAVLLGPIDASAQGRRARLSRDLVQRLESVTDTATCVIVPGTRAQVDGLAARHGLTIRKRL